MQSVHVIIDGLFELFSTLVEEETVVHIEGGIEEERGPLELFYIA